MDENKELNTELQEEVEETTLDAEEVAEEVEEISEEAPEEASEEEYEEYEYEVYEEEDEEEGKSNKALTVVSILISLAIVVLSFISSMNTNKYNIGYIDIYGETVQDLADSAGLSLEEFLELCNLPADMPGNTNTNAAENAIPAGIVATQTISFVDSMKSFGMFPKTVSGFEFYKLAEGMPADVTEDTPIGKAMEKVKLKYVVEDEKGLEEFKTKYGLGDDVTLETEYGKVRGAVDLYKKKEVDAQRALEQELLQQIQEETEEVEETTSEE